MTGRRRNSDGGIGLEDLADMLDEQSVLLQRLIENTPAQTASGGGNGAKPKGGPTLAAVEEAVLEALSNLDAQSRMLEELSRSPPASEEALSTDRETAAAVRTAAADIARAASADRAWFRILVWVVLALAVPGALALGLLAQASLQILPPGMP